MACTDEMALAVAGAAVMSFWNSMSTTSVFVLCNGLVPAVRLVSCVTR